LAISNICIDITVCNVWRELVGKSLKNIIMKKYRKNCNLPIVMVTCQYDSKKNAVKETRVGTTYSTEEAEDWLNSTTKPAYIYVDGMQDHDAFLKLFFARNDSYTKEYEKVID